MRVKRSIVLLIAFVLGVIAVIYTFTYMDQGMQSAQNMDTSTAAGSGRALGTSLGVTLAIPHLIFSVLGTLFCGLAWLFKLRWSAIAAGVFYAIAIVLMFPWFYLVIAQMILCFVGAGVLGKRKTERAIERKLNHRA